MKYKKILMIGLIGVLSIGTLVGCKIRQITHPKIQQKQFKI